MSISTVVLDLDGTLVDSAYVHTTAWVRAFADVGIRVPAHRVHRAIGMGGDRLVEHLTDEETERTAGDRVRARHAERLDERFDEIVPTDGASELLAGLRERGCTLVLASSSDGDLTERLLGLVEAADDLLHDSVSGSAVGSSKPAPDLIDVALDAVAAESAVVVGDSVWDVEAAARAGVDCWGVLTGGFSAAELLEAGARRVFDSPRDLLGRLDETRVVGVSIDG